MHTNPQIGDKHYLDVDVPNRLVLIKSRLKNLFYI